MKLRATMLLIGLTFCAMATASEVPARKIVVVELFTSEGCSSCPPAEQQLAMAAKDQPFAGVQILPLAWHVDYFNNPWVDQFSSKQWTARQNEYGQRFGLGSVYTPQMVVDGTREFVGGEKKSFNEEITRAGTTKGGVALDATIDKDGKSIAASVRVSSLPKVSDGDVAEVFVIVTEGGFRIPIKRGENGGSTLRHDSVVRFARQIGKVDANTPDRFTGETKIDLDAAWKRERLSVVVLVQEQRSGRILAAGISAPAPSKQP